MKKVFLIVLVIMAGGLMFFGSAEKTGAATRPVITSPTYLPESTANESYRYQLEASGGIAPYAWKTPSRTPIWPDALPPGISLSSTGFISGTPKMPSGAIQTEYKFSVDVIDKDEVRGTKVFYLTVNPASTVPIAEPQITSTTLPGGILNQYYRYQFNAESTSNSFEWSQGSQKIATDLELYFNPEGLLYGTPKKQGDHDFDVCVKDKVSTLTKCKNFSLVISSGKALKISPSSLPEEKPGKEYKQTISVTGGASPYNWNIISKPDWLSYNISSGNRDKLYISGTPSEDGLYVFYFEIKDSSSPQQETWASFDIRINSVISSPPPAGGGAPSGGGTITRQCEGQPLEFKNPGFYKAGDKTVAYDGLVPCGKCVIVSNQSIKELKEKGTVSGLGNYEDCQFCHFFVMFDGVTDFLINNIIIPLGLLMLVIGGAFFVFSAGDPGRTAKGKAILTSVSIGLLIIFAAWLIVNVVFTFLGLSKFGLELVGPGNWFDPSCLIDQVN